MATGLTNQNVLFVGGLPRTGGSLLPFMLDGIAGVYTPPFELHIAGVTGGDIQEADFSDSDPNRTVALTSRLKVLDKENHPPAPISCKTGKRFTFNSMDFFKEYHAEVACGEVNSKNYLAAKIAAFFAGIKRPLPEGAMWLIAHSGKAMTHDTVHFLETNEIGQYIYTRRDGVAWWRSYCMKFRNLPMLRDQKVVDQFLEVKLECDELAEEYQRRFGDRYMILDYEGLVDSPNEIVSEICHRLGIEVPATHDPKPTFLGIPVPANSSFKEFRKQTEIIPSFMSRPEILDPSIKDLVENFSAAQPARPAPYGKLTEDDFRAVARQVHRRFYVLESFRKQLSKAERVARKARRQEKLMLPANG